MGRTVPSRQPSRWNGKQKGAQKPLPTGHAVLMTWARDLSLVTSRACWTSSHVRPVLEVPARPRAVPSLFGVSVLLEAVPVLLDVRSLNPGSSRPRITEASGMAMAAQEF